MAGTTEELQYIRKLNISGLGISWKCTVLQFSVRSTDHNHLLEDNPVAIAFQLLEDLTYLISEAAVITTMMVRFVCDDSFTVLFAQLSDEFSSLVWTTSPDQAKHLLRIPEESFVDAVNDAYVSGAMREFPSHTWRNKSFPNV